MIVTAEFVTSYGHLSAVTKLNCVRRNTRSWNSLLVVKDAVTCISFDLRVYITSWVRLLVGNKWEDCLSFSGGRLAEEISTDFHLLS
jgi:hypothetical protein